MRTMFERTEAKWLRGLDLPADGSPIFVYVHAVWAEQVRNPQTDQTEEQTIVSFADDHGNLVLKPYIFSGQENATRMGLEVANNPEDWPGTYVRLWAVDTRNPKTRQPARGIRIGGGTAGSSRTEAAAANRDATDTAGGAAHHGAADGPGHAAEAWTRGPGTAISPTGRWGR